MISSSLASIERASCTTCSCQSSNSVCFYNIRNWHCEGCCFFEILVSDAEYTIWNALHTSTYLWYVSTCVDWMADGSPMNELVLFFWHRDLYDVGFFLPWICLDRQIRVIKRQRKDIFNLSPSPFCFYLFSYTRFFAVFYKQTAPKHCQNPKTQNEQKYHTETRKHSWIDCRLQSAVYLW